MKTFSILLTNTSRLRVHLYQEIKRAQRNFHYA